MALTPVRADVALSATAQGAGTVTGGPIAAAGAAAEVILAVHCSAVSGTPTLDVSLQQSSDGASWSAVAGSSITQLTAVGNRLAVAGITANYVRATATVGGTTPSVTFTASLWVRS
jgi:hypothetical protein